jgi:hypothetical protein
MDIRQTAYAKWLNSLAAKDAGQAILRDLTRGPKDSMAWDIMDDVFDGKWSAPAYAMKEKCEEAALRLRNEGTDT